MQPALVVDVATEAMEELIATLGGKQTGNRRGQIPETHELFASLANGLEETNRRRIGNVERIR